MCIYAEMGKAGTLTKLRKTHWEGPPPEPGAGVTALDVDNVGGMFVMLFAGTAVGLLIGVIEFFVGAFKEKSNGETLCEKIGHDCKLAATCKGNGAVCSELILMIIRMHEIEKKLLIVYSATAFIHEQVAEKLRRMRKRIRKPPCSLRVANAHNAHWRDLTEAQDIESGPTRMSSALPRRCNEETETWNEAEAAYWARIRLRRSISCGVTHYRLIWVLTAAAEIHRVNRRFEAATMMETA